MQEFLLILLTFIISPTELSSSHYIQACVNSHILTHNLHICTYLKGVGKWRACHGGSTCCFRTTSFSQYAVTHRFPSLSACMTMIHWLCNKMTMWVKVPTCNTVITRFCGSYSSVGDRQFNLPATSTRAHPRAQHYHFHILNPNCPSLHNIHILPDTVTLLGLLDPDHKGNELLQNIRLTV